MIYEDVFERLEREGVAYVVVGGVALVLHGFDRPTADLDLVVDCAGDGAERATRALAGAGFFPTVPLPLSALTVLRMLDRGGRQVDVFARFLVPFAELLAGSTQVLVGATPVRVASLEHMARVLRLGAQGGEKV